LSTASRIIKNTGWLYGRIALTMFITLWTTRIVLKALGASDFGIYNIVGGAVTMLGFLNGTMVATTQRFIAHAEGEGNHTRIVSVFNVSLIIHWVIALVAALALAVAGFVFFGGVLSIPADRLNAAYLAYASLVITTVFVIISTPYDAILNAHENMRYYALVGAVEALLRLLTAFACLYTSGDKLMVYAVLMSIIPIVTRVFMQVYCKLHYSECVIAPRRYYNRGILVEMTRFASYEFLISFSTILLHSGMGVLLNHFYGTLLNAAHGIANQLSGMLESVSVNMQKAVSPVIMKSEGGGNRNKMVDFTLLGCRFSFFIYSFFTIPIIVEMHYVLTLWLGEVPEWAVLFCQLQLLRVMLRQLTSSVDSALKAEGRIMDVSRVEVWIYLAPLAFTFLAFWFGMPPYWMYISLFLFWGFGIIVAQVYFMKRNCGMPVERFLREVVLKCICVAVTAFFVSLVVQAGFEEGILRLCMVGGCTVVAYSIAMWTLGMTGNERVFVKDAFRSLQLFTKNTSCK